MKRLTPERILRELTPPLLVSLAKVVRSRPKNGKASSSSAGAVTGARYLQYARDYSATIGGETEAFERGLSALIASGDNAVGRTAQEMLVAFSPDYKNNLFQYYKNQQYNLLFRFLQYPFIDPTLAAHVQPYECGLARFETLDVLDYGSGVPYGLVECLLTAGRSKVRSVTLVDLDLVHTEFTEYLIKRIAPDVKLTMVRVQDTNAFPELAGRYNVIYGKDIFEHLTAPETMLRKLVSCAAEHCACYFDFADRDKVIYQHVSPKLSSLHGIMADLGFQRAREIHRVSEYLRG